MSKHIRPKFNREMPKNSRTFFSPNSDDEFKAEHPIGYVVLVTCGITALLLPCVIYYFSTNHFFPISEGSWQFIGIVGSFISGIGLFNIVAAWIEQYLGHIVTISCFALGIIMILISCLMAT